MKLHELDNNKPFSFTCDKNSTVYWKGKCAGMYAQVFATESDLKKFERPSFVDCSTQIKEIK
jgi:hypothetical protein